MLKIILEFSFRGVHWEPLLVTRLKEVKVIKGSYDPLKGVEKFDTLHFHVPHIKLRGYIPLTQFGHKIPTELHMAPHYTVSSL